MRKSTLFVLVLIAMSLLGAGIVRAIMHDGIATWMDTAQYFRAARSLTSGDGLLDCFGRPLTRWTPLYPLALATVNTLGFPPLESARLLNTVAFGLIILTAGWLYRNALRSRFLVLVGTGAALLSWPQVLWSVHALSETLFTLLLLLFVLQCWRFLRSFAVSQLLLLAFVAALAPMQRYLGMSVIAAGFLCILFLSSRPIVTRIKWGVEFGFLSSMPLVAWIVRNYLVSGTPTGSRSPWSLADLGTHIELFSSPMLDWLIPQRIGRGFTVTGSAALDLVVLLAIGLFPIVLYWRSRGQSWVAGLQAVHPVSVAAILTAIYVLVTLVGAPLVNFSGDAARVAAPLYPLFILFLLFALERFGLWLDSLTGGPVATLIIIGVATLWLILPAEKIWREYNLLVATDGWRGFSSMAMRMSPLVDWEQPELIDDPIFTNNAAPICINAERYVQTFSRTDSDLATQQLLDSGEDTFTLIVFPAAGRFQLSYPLVELTEGFEVEQLVALEGGGIYRLIRRD